MDFGEYYESGEEEFKEIIIPTSEEEDKKETEISEGLVDVIFQNLKTNTKVSVAGPIILFRWEWVLNKTVFTLRVRKKVFKDFVNWLNKIVEYSEDNSK